MTDKFETLYKSITDMIEKTDIEDTNKKVVISTILQAQTFTSLKKLCGKKYLKVSGCSAGNITGTTGTFTGNVSVGGTLTYDDVTRIDSVGIVTAGGGLYVGRTEGTGTGIGATVHTTGNAVFAGIVTASSYYGDASTMTNAGISAGKSVALAAFLGC